MHEKKTSLVIGCPKYYSIYFVILVVLFIKLHNRRGLVTGSYLVWYGACRFILESFRQEKYILKLGSIPVSKLMAGVMVLVGIVIIVLAIRGKTSTKPVENKKKE